MGNREEMTTGKVIGLIKSAASGGGGGGGGTTNYNQLSNKPKINNVELSGNKTLSDLGIESPVIPRISFDDSTQTYVCDMTFAEIMQAVQDGTCLYAAFFSTMCGLMSQSGDAINFGTVASTESQVLSAIISISSEDVVTVTDNQAAIPDVQINGTSIVNEGVANIPVASDSALGAVKVDNTLGVKLDSNNKLAISGAGLNTIKQGTSGAFAIVPGHQHESAFWGMAKAAGDSTQASSSNAVGTYTPQAKAAIQSMLGVETGVCFVETVSGATPSITAEANVRYVCGTVSTITITPPANGTTIVRFGSGSTPAVLTLPNTVKFPDGLDLTTLEANTIYEIMITDGIYGGVVTWAD